MTPEEWQGGTDPLGMINAVADGLSDRRLRLFLVACCRRLAHLPAGSRLRAAVEAAGRFADGECGPEALQEAGRRARDEVSAADREQPWRWLPRLGGAVLAACLPPGELAGRFASFTGRYMLGSRLVMKGVDAAAEAAAYHAADRGADSPERALAAERAEQCRLLRDVAGDPSRPVRVDPSWLAWNDGVVVRLARGVYDDRAFGRMPVLADALEEAGCADGAILAHLRGPGPHVRGCRVLDAVLGKN